MSASHNNATQPSKVEVWERIFDIPLLVLALACIPLLVLEDMSAGSVARGAMICNWVIWGVFAVDLPVRVWLVRTKRWRYLLYHWYDVGIIVITIIPYFLPFRAVRSVRALRILRAARVVTFAVRFWNVSIRVWGNLAGRALLILMAGIVIAGSAGVWMLERDSNGSIDNYGDAAWWAITTVTTVGYGDIAPVTTEGRVIASVLMVTGIALFGVVTANVVGAMTRKSSKLTNDEEDPIITRLDKLQEAIEELQQRQN